MHHACAAKTLATAPPVCSPTRNGAGTVAPGTAIAPNLRVLNSTYQLGTCDTPIFVAGRSADGTLWVVDGQQRLEALKKLGKTTVRVQVFASKGPEHEAKIYGYVNGNRTNLTTSELYLSKLTAGDEFAWRVKEIIEEEGFGLHLVSSGMDRDLIPTEMRFLRYSGRHGSVSLAMSRWCFCSSACWTFS